jgi:hypothetical protein
VNDLPFTRFVHGNCHTPDAFIPSSPSYPDLCSFQFHDGRLSCYNQPGCGNGTGCGYFDFPCGMVNPVQTAPLLCHFSASLFPFVNSTTHSVSQGHHDAGDYSKYVINSALFVHILTFAADNFPGVRALDDLGIPESGDGISDVLQLAKWEADFLAKMQDADGGFYFLVYPEYSEYESATPDRAPRQVLYPKTTSATASAVGALADIASSPAFAAQYPSVAQQYLSAAENGWTFLMNALSQYGKPGAYQKITLYGDDFTHDDELLWASAALFTATGSATYHNQFLSWLPNPFPQRDGYWRLFAGWGCAARDYAFAVRSGRLTGGLNSTALSECENEILAAGNDWLTWSQNTSYGTSLPNPTKAQFNPGWFFSTDPAYEIAVADALDQTFPSSDPRYNPQRHPNFVEAILENFNYQHGCNPVNVAFVNGNGWKRQRVTVNQYANYPNYDMRLLPPSGIPLGNMSDTYNDSTLNPIAYPAVTSGATAYGLYDRWADIHNLRTEFVSIQAARALAAAGRLHNLSAAASPSWQSAVGFFTFLNGSPVLNTAASIRLDTSDSSVDLNTASILWDVEGESQPAFGRTFTLRPHTAPGETLVEAEAVLPDGRRVFGRQYVEINDPVNGGSEYVLPDPTSHTVALYHFDNSDPLHPFRDDTLSGYDMSPSGFPALNGNNSWMQTRSGYAAQFGGLGDRLTSAAIPDSSVRPAGANGFTIEFRIYPKRFQFNGTPLYLLRFAQGSGDGSEWSIYYSTGLAAFPQVFGPNGQVVLSSSTWSAQMTPNIWHLVKITVDTTGFTTVYVDGNSAASHATSPSYSGQGWTLSMGDFAGCFDEVRISNTIR